MSRVIIELPDTCPGKFERDDENALCARCFFSYYERWCSLLGQDNLSATHLSDYAEIVEVPELDKDCNCDINCGFLYHADGFSACSRGWDEWEKNTIGMGMAGPGCPRYEATSD